MGLLIRETGKMINLMEMEFINLAMVHFMKVNSFMDQSQEKENLHLVMDQYIQGIFWMDFSMVKVF
jgi:hypothetical protein